MEEKIKIIYNMLIYNLVLSDINLNKHGIMDEDIQELLMKKIITKKSDRTYTILKVDKLRCYGIELLKDKKIYEANLCFKKCYDLAPHGRDICLQIMLAEITRYNYKRAFEIFANLEKIHPEKNMVNNNLYLYLLNVITECPKEYTTRIKEMSYDDITLPYSSSNKSENEIRWNIWRGKYTHAFKKVNDIIRKQNTEENGKQNYSVKFELLKVLLARATDQEKEFKKELLELAQNKEYRQIVSKLEERKQTRDADALMVNILIISKAIIEVLEKEIIPKPTINYTLDLYEALNGNNFKLALDINKSFMTKYGIDENKDIINILLIDLNNMITSVKEYRDPLEVIESKNELTNNDNLEVNPVVSQEQDELTKEILDAEYWVDYILSENINIDQARKSFGLNLELTLMIKLAYAMNCYGYKSSENKYISVTEESIKEADLILQEVELCKDKTPKVLEFIERVKQYNSNHNNTYKKVLSK